MIMKNQRVEDGVSQYSERIKGALVTMATIEFSSSYTIYNEFNFQASFLVQELVYSVSDACYTDLGHIVMLA